MEDGKCRMKKEFEQEQIGTSPTIAPHGGTEDAEKMSGAEMVNGQRGGGRQNHGGQNHKPQTKGKDWPARITFVVPFVTI
jgi:hypothetical protein